MATYVIGDIQGCDRELRRLIERIGFDPKQDRLWFVGDLVNRGPDSLAVLRFVKGLGPTAVSVLGNHDLHLLAVAAGVRAAGRADDFSRILAAADRDELLYWLRQRPLLHHDDTLSFTMVHAGLAPQWDLPTARRCAMEVEHVLRSDREYIGFLRRMYGNEPDRWSERLAGIERLRFILNCFTRLRFCNEMGALILDEKGPPFDRTDGLRPWFDVPGRRSVGERLVFGHWSTLGRFQQRGIYALDSGCVWGGALTALRIDGEPVWFQEPCRGYRRPGLDD